ncbi:hypothetical protein QR680_018363 [Steinernema hermaphroditum]|uniref:Uncharacterized protein n=1 Tax=Steinernema hermaphroditum TaxID=289476 RepID=A0AA39HHQ4_9BILA|nr:hypothetical protein QR680_018363 [Steinernema hermaphroditum]
MNSMLFFLSLLLPTSVLSFDDYEQLESCHVKLHDLHMPRHLMAHLSKRSQMCSVQLRAQEGHSLRVTFHSLRRVCNIKKDSVFVIEEGRSPVNMCDSESNVFVSPSKKVTVRYHTATELTFDVSQLRDKLHCREDLLYNHFGRSLTLESNGVNDTCLVTFPGRVKVIIEELRLSQPDCDSAVSIVMGPNYKQYEYRAGHFCKQHNGLLNVEKKVICHRGLLVFKTSPSAKDFVRFRIEVPEEHEERPFLVHRLEC